MADPGYISDRDPGQTAAARQIPYLIEHSRDALLLEDTAGGLSDPVGRQIDGIVIVPADRLAVVDPGLGFHGLDCDVPALGDVLPDIDDRLPVWVECQRVGRVAKTLPGPPDCTCDISLVRKDAKFLSEVAGDRYDRERDCSSDLRAGGGRAGDRARPR